MWLKGQINYKPLHLPHNLLPAHFSSLELWSSRLFPSSNTLGLALSPFLISASYDPATSSKFIAKNAFSVEPFLMAHHCPVVIHLAISTAHTCTSPLQQQVFMKHFLCARQGWLDMTLRILCLGNETDTSTDALYDNLISDAWELKHTSTEHLMTLLGKWQIQPGAESLVQRPHLLPPVDCRLPGIVFSSI